MRISNLKTFQMHRLTKQIASVLNGAQNGHKITFLKVRGSLGAYLKNTIKIKLSSNARFGKTKGMVSNTHKGKNGLPKIFNSTSVSIAPPTCQISFL